MRESIKVSAILLGAGESKRLGINKLQLPWGKKTILEKCLQTFLRSKVKEVVVVLNEKLREMETRLKQKRVKIIFNPEYRKGMSASIHYGLRVIHPKSQGVLIALGDQPNLNTKTINALIHHFQQSKKGIIVPSYLGKMGHPVLFHRKYFNDLFTLDGDRGGKSIIKKNEIDVEIVSTTSKGVIQDIDTWEDYQTLKRSCSSQEVKKESRHDIH